MTCRQSCKVLVHVTEEIVARCVVMVDATIHVGVVVAIVVERGVAGFPDGDVVLLTGVLFCNGAHIAGVEECVIKVAACVFVPGPDVLEEVVLVHEPFCGEVLGLFVCFGVLTAVLQVVSWPAGERLLDEQCECCEQKQGVVAGHYVRRRTAAEWWVSGATEVWEGVTRQCR